MKRVARRGRRLISDMRSRDADRQLLRPAARDRASRCDSKRERVRIVQMHWQEKNECGGSPR